RRARRRARAPRAAVIGLATRRRPRAAPAVAALAVIVATGLSLLVGIQPVTPADLVAALADPGAAGSAVVVHLRVPRTAAGLLAGAGLGLAGAVAQGLTRNPLAGPEVLGVNGGAAFAGVVALALAAVLAIASAGRGGATPGTIAVVG